MPLKKDFGRGKKEKNCEGPVSTPGSRLFFSRNEKRTRAASGNAAREIGKKPYRVSICMPGRRAFRRTGKEAQGKIECGREKKHGS